MDQMSRSKYIHIMNKDIALREKK